MLELKLDKTEFTPGETVSGTANWHIQHRPKTAYITLGWHTEGKGDEDVHCQEQIEVTQLVEQGYQTFNFTLPEKPYSFSGKLISLIWMVEFTLDKEAERKEIIVSPTRKEYIIARGEEQPF